MTSSDGLQTNTRRFELYVHLSMYALLAFEPLVVIAVTAPGQRPASMVASLLHAVANVVVCRWALHTAPSPVRLDRRLVLVGVGWLALSVATLLVVIGNLGDQAALGPILTVTVGASVAAVAPAFRPRWIPIIALVGAVVTGCAVAGREVLDVPTSIGLATGLFFSLTLLGFSFWLSGWMLKVVRELDLARRSAADLAIAEERLRIARDLHDLYGRTLATIAVKSELAAELIRRGLPDAAADEIGAVRVIADASGREVRQLVQGYREADLAAELMGARSLLDSAGIRCVVEGSVPVGLDPEVASGLAWTLREAVTNVIRHSRAGECFIRVAAGPEVRLTVTNNGAAQPSPEAGVDPSDGSGLVGMGERLAALDGRLEHWRAGDRFTVEAVVPARHAATSGQPIR
jgi:two-component system sensor histidine kinase DesK